MNLGFDEERMLKRIAKLPGLRSTNLVHLIRTCSNGLNRVIDQNAIKERMEKSRFKDKLCDEMLNRTKQLSDELRSTKINSELIDNKPNLKTSTEQIEEQEEIDLLDYVVYCEDIPSILHAIEPHLSNIVANDLFTIYHQINFNIISSKRHKIGDPNQRPYRMNVELLQSSSIFRSLVDHTVNKIDELNVACLSQVINVFSLSMQKLDPRINEIILTNLRSKLNDLELKEILICSKSLDSYSKVAENDKLLLNLKKSLLDKAKVKILSNQFETNDIDSICKCFNIFLHSLDSDPDFQMINHLTTILLSPQSELDLKNAVLVMKSINQANYHYRTSLNSPVLLYQLIEKCNSTIFNIISADPKSQNVLFYVKNIHQYKVQPNFNLKNLFDPKIIDLIAPILIEESYYFPNAKFLIFTMMYNYARFQIYNERLLMYIYDLIRNDSNFMAHAGVTNIFNLYSRYRLPFIDYQNLAKILFFDNFNLIKLVLDNKTTGLMIFCNLLLNDVILNREAFDNFEQLISSQLNDLKFVRQFSFNNYKTFLVAKAHLESFVELEASLKDEIKRKMNDWNFQISLKNKRLNNFSTNLIPSDKLLLNAYLSNGILIGTVGIYDDSIKGMISITKYKDYLDKVEQIPLNKNQQM